MPQVTAVNTDAGCEVWVRDDPAGDVKVHLERNLLEVHIIHEEAPSHDLPEGGIQRLLVQDPDGDPIPAEQVLPFLRENTDFDVLSEETFGADAGN